MISIILGLLTFIFFVKLTLKITWTFIKVLVYLFVYGTIFILITALFGFVILSPMLFVAGVAWMVGRAFMRI